MCNYLSVPGISFGILAGGSGSGEPKGGCAGWQLQQVGAELWSTHTSVIGQSGAICHMLPVLIQRYAPVISSLGNGCQASVTDAEICD